MVTVGRTHVPSLSLMVSPLALLLSFTLSYPCYANAKVDWYVMN